jgi:hypothetical protein
MESHAPEELATFRQDLAWDAPENRSVADFVPTGYFVSPFEPTPTRPVSNYLGVAGLGFIFDVHSLTRLDEISDGPENTILYVEYVPSSFHWAAPKDLTFDEYAAYVANPSHQPSGHGFGVVLADGSVRYFKPGLTREELRSLFTIAGSEPIDDAWFMQE